MDHFTFIFRKMSQRLYYKELLLYREWLYIEYAHTRWNSITPLTLAVATYE